MHAHGISERSDTFSHLPAHDTVTAPALEFVRFLFSPKARTLVVNFGRASVRLQN